MAMNEGKPTTEKDFFEYVKEHIKEYLPEEYADAEVLINQVDKTNGTILNGMILKCHGEEAFPVVYLDSYYNAIVRGGVSLHEVMVQIAEAQLTSNQLKVDVDSIKEMVCNWEQAKQQIVGRVVNTYRNESLFESMPHFDKMDLSMMFGLCLTQSDLAIDGIATIRVTNEMMDRWGVTEKELFDQAVDNMNRMYPFRVMDMAALLEEVMGPGAMLFDDMQLTSEEGMYVITNTTKLNGACVMFTDEAFAQLADRLGDLYIMPSSIHEVIAVSAKHFEAEDLAEMVREVNATEVRPEEQLSDHVYHYSKDRHCIEIADDPGFQDKLNSQESEVIDFGGRRRGR